MSGVYVRGILGIGLCLRLSACAIARRGRLKLMGEAGGVLWKLAKVVCVCVRERESARMKEGGGEQMRE